MDLRKNRGYEKGGIPIHVNTSIYDKVTVDWYTHIRIHMLEGIWVICVVGSGYPYMVNKMERSMQFCFGRFL